MNATPPLIASPCGFSSHPSYRPQEPMTVKKVAALALLLFTSLISFALFSFEVGMFTTLGMSLLLLSKRSFAPRTFFDRTLNLSQSDLYQRRRRELMSPPPLLPRVRVLPRAGAAGACPPPPPRGRDYFEPPIRAGSGHSRREPPSRSGGFVGKTFQTSPPSGDLEEDARKRPPVKAGSGHSRREPPRRLDGFVGEAFPPSPLSGELEEDARKRPPVKASSRKP